MLAEYMAHAAPAIKPATAAASIEKMAHGWK